MFPQPKICGACAHDHLLHGAADVPVTQAALPVAGDQHQSNRAVARTFHDLLGRVAIRHQRLAPHASLHYPRTHVLQIAFGLCPAQLPLQWIHRAQPSLLLRQSKHVHEQQLCVKRARQSNGVR
jgi:hypothetical protein